MKYLILAVFSFTLSIGLTQENIIMEQEVYATIPENPESYNAGGILSRMVDGLGYRYHWGSKDLRQEDLDYKPSADAVSTFETIDHVYNLSVTILNVAKGLPNIRPYTSEELSYDEFRLKTLGNLAEASEIFRSKTDEEIGQLNVVFQRGEKKNIFPIWNLINGQIADALYHTGQIVSFRRTTGNPLDSSVSVFTGKNREG